jgi:hypothetical protein
VGGRGDGNLRHTVMPAVLLEPGFASNPKQARLMESPGGIRDAARTILQGAAGYDKIALSVGHKGKPRSTDMGAAWSGERFRWEAEWAEAVIDTVEKLADADGAPFQTRIGATHTLMRAYPDWACVGFRVLASGTLLEPIKDTTGKLLVQNTFQFYREPGGLSGWVPISHVTD